MGEIILTSIDHALLQRAQLLLVLFFLNFSQ